MSLAPYPPQHTGEAVCSTRGGSNCVRTCDSAKLCTLLRMPQLHDLAVRPQSLATEKGLHPMNSRDHRKGNA